jgi:hypothetical protein
MNQTNQNSRMALCIYGDPRMMEFCFPSVKKHILDVYNPDVFICSSEQEDKIRELYNPIAIEIYSRSEEKEIIGERLFKYGAEFPPPPNFCPKRPPEDLSGMFKAWRCGEMLKEREKITGVYDVIVGTRFDDKFLYIQPITIPEKDTVYIPRIDACLGVADKNGVFWGCGWSAHIWWGSSVIAQVVLDVYHLSDDYWNASGIWNPEMVLKWYCDAHNIKVCYTEVTHMLIRGDSTHPRSHELGSGFPLSKTCYPEYLEDSLPPDPKPRVALCVYGQPRTMEFCFPSLKKHIIDVYRPDIFICSDEQEERIKELYHPVSIEIASKKREWEMVGDRKLKYGNIIPVPGWDFPNYHVNVPETLSAMFKVWRCGELLKEHEEKFGVYDIVIGTRFDIKFLHVQSIVIQDKNCFYLPRVDASQWPASDKYFHWKLGYSAHTWWGSSIMAHKILDLYNWSDDYFKNVGVFSGEILLKNYCGVNKIKVNYTEVTQMIIRNIDNVLCAWDRSPLTKTHYPEYLSSPFPKAKHIPYYEPWTHIEVTKNQVQSVPQIHKPHVSRMEKRHNKQFLRMVERRKNK